MDSLDFSCTLVGPPRITRNQALAFTATRAIGKVAGSIYDTAQSLGIDPAFALAEAILETGWGTSSFAVNRHNWYGYEAYYENANQARTFGSDDEGIRLPLEDMHRNYFTPGGSYYQNAAGRTLQGWASQWINGGPAHWQDACRQILWLMQAAIRCGDTPEPAGDSPPNE